MKTIATTSMRFALYGVCIGLELACLFGLRAQQRMGDEIGRTLALVLVGAAVLNLVAVTRTVRLASRRRRLRYIAMSPSHEALVSSAF